MFPRNRLAVPLLSAVITLTAGCSTFSSGVSGRYDGTAATNDSGDVSVLFIFRHVRMTTGWDAIPKLQGHGIRDFHLLFGDALAGLSNISSYETFTDDPDNVTSPERRTRRDALIAGSDYTVVMEFNRTRSFARDTLATIGSTMSVTVLPMPYIRRYSLHVDVFDADGGKVAAYDRSGTLTTWVECALIFAYPFHPERRKEEELYMDFLHGVFRQMEAEGILRPRRA